MKKLFLKLLKFDYLLLFVLNALGMILELVASRLISPYFGNSNLVWTAIIGIILLAGSLGNIVGGKISTRKNSKIYVAALLMVGSMCLSLIPLIGEDVLLFIKNLNIGVQAASVISAILLFLVPSTILGIVTPVIMKNRLEKSRNHGEESGRITAIIAIGSLIGTFAGGFWLIPAMGTNLIFVLLSIILILSSLGVWVFSAEQKNVPQIIYYLFLSLALVLVVAGILKLNTSNDGPISIDTEYGRIIIEDGVQNDEPVRLYKQSGAYSSATFLSEDKKYDLVFDYVKKYDEMFNYLDVKNVAMIGGAAYQYPKYFISHFLDKKMDVIEIDPASTEIAKKYFFLDDLISDYGEDRLGLYNDDGRVFLNNTNKKYDAILNDAFAGEVPVETLATLEAAQIIKSKLNKNGVYMSNMLTTLAGEKAKFLRSEVKTLKEVFKNVYVMPVYEGVTDDDFTNWMLIATDNDSYKPSDARIVEVTDEDIVLTDDYCPINSMIRTNYFD